MMDLNTLVFWLDQEYENWIGKNSNIFICLETATYSAFFHQIGLNEGNLFWASIFELHIFNGDDCLKQLLLLNTSFVIRKKYNLFSAKIWRHKNKEGFIWKNISIKCFPFASYFCLNEDYLSSHQLIAESAPPFPFRTPGQGAAHSGDTFW